MEDVSVVTAFLRHRSDVLLLKRSAAVGSYAGRWGTVAGHVEDGDPDASARQEIRDETGLTEHDVSLVRRGAPFDVADGDRGTRWRVHPYLFEAATRSVSLNWETDAADWAAPTALLRRDTVPGLWRSYARIAPSISTLRSDDTHGSATLSIRALEVLRDRAAAVAAGVSSSPSPVETARRLVEARPSMTALANRVHRVMHGCLPHLNADAIERAAHAATDAAAEADARAAHHAANAIAGQRVLTLSRSGTVHEAIEHAKPPSVVVAASQPGGEGVAVAERWAAAGMNVTLIPDAAVASVLADGAVDAVLVGADTVLPNGGVVNKVGTRGMALAAQHEGVPVSVACAADKVSPAPTVPNESVDRAAVYNGNAPLTVDTRLFDLTPPSSIGSIYTEDGPQPPGAIRKHAQHLRTLRTWQDAT